MSDLIIKVCVACKSQPVLYRSPSDEKILGCCSNSGCKTRKKPPISGSDAFAALVIWNREFGL